MAKVTISQIAKEAGVSKTAVSFAFNDPSQLADRGRLPIAGPEPRPEVMDAFDRGPVRVDGPALHVDLQAESRRIRRELDMARCSPHRGHGVSRRSVTMR